MKAPVQYKSAQSAKDRQTERHMASQSAEKETKKEHLLIFLPFHWCFPQSVHWSPEVALLSLGPWLFSWRSLGDEQKSLAHSASSCHHCCLWDTLAVRLGNLSLCPALCFPPFSAQTHHVGLSAAPAQGSLSSPMWVWWGLLWSHFPCSATSFTSSLPCTAASFPASTLGSGEMGWAKWSHGGFEKHWVLWVWSLELPWGSSLSLLAAAQFTLWRTSAVLCEGQSAASEYRECGSHVFSLCLEFLLYIRKNMCTLTLTCQKVFSSSF